MKKKIVLICGGALIIAIIILFLVLSLSGNKYIIRISLIDDKSPDRLLIVYKGDEKIEVKRIEYLDGTLLCYGYNTAVYYGDIDKEDKFRIILKDNSEVIAEIIKEEVK